MRKLTSLNHIPLPFNLPHMANTLETFPQSGQRRFEPTRGRFATTWPYACGGLRPKVATVFRAVVGGRSSNAASMLERFVDQRPTRRTMCAHNPTGHTHHPQGLTLTHFANTCKQASAPSAHGETSEAIGTCKSRQQDIHGAGVGY